MSSEVDIEEKAILVRINKLYRNSMTADELYEATRGVWKLGDRRYEADYALTVYRGEVKEVYRIDSWVPAGTTPYASRTRSEVEVPGRWEFTGTLAADSIRRKYLYKSVKHYFQRGAANPIVYVNC